jgi:hypothetical protein
MNNADLNNVLKKAQVPEPRPEFWDELPMNVQRAIDRGEPCAESRARAPAGRPGLSAWLWKKAMPLGFAAIGLALGLIWGVRSRHGEAVQNNELAEARACWREAAALFPNQLQAIVFDQQGSRLVVSELANQPFSPPIYLSLCDGKRCNRFITFSGQLIKVNGESFEVLIDRQGEVLLVGDAKVWKNSKDASNLGAYKVFARPLAST